MSWSINDAEGRVVAATGEAFEAYHLTPERADILLAAIDAHGGKASTAQLAQALGRNIPDASRLLQELAERGAVRAVLEKNRPQWERLTLNLNAGLVREQHKAPILAYLVGRRELPGRIASALGLNREEVNETCKALMVEGQLVGTPIGAAMVYALDLRGSTRVDLEAAAQVPLSPAARFQAELAALPPEKPLRLRPSAGAAVGTNRPRKLTGLIPLEQAARAAGLGPRQVRGLVNRRRVGHQGQGDGVLVDIEDLKAIKPRLRKKGGTPKARRQARRVISAILPDEPESLRAIDAARRLGVKPCAFYKWLEQHDEARALCNKGKKYLMVPPRVLVLYAQASLPAGATFATEVPADWLDIWQTVESLGWSYSKIYRMLADGRLTAVQCGGKLRFDPVSVRALKTELDAEETVPEGWISLRALAMELGGLDISSVTSWFQRRNVELRRYRDAQRQTALYVQETVADTYRTYRASTPGGIKLTPEIQAAIRAELPPIEPGKRRPAGAVSEVATRYGVSSAAVRILLRTSTNDETFNREAAD